MTRLPSVGGDNGTWGDVLNDFLTQSHNGDGTLKANSVGAPQLKPNSVTNAAIADASVSAAKLATAGQADGIATLGSDGTVPDAQLPTRLSDTSLSATYATAAQGAKADAAIPAAQMGVASGVATLDGSGLLPDAQVPSRLSASQLAETIATTNGYVLVASDTAPADTTRYGVPVLWLDTNEVIAAVPVNPPVPTWNDATSQFTVPSGVVGVDYVWTSGGGGIGATMAQGSTVSTSGTFPRTVVITPVAQSGYVLASGITTFNHDFPDTNPALTSVLTSDTFTGAAGPLIGRTTDVGLGGMPEAWTAGSGAVWNTDGAGAVVFVGGTAGGWTTLVQNGSQSAQNIQVEFDLVSNAGSSVGTGVGLGLWCNPGFGLWIACTGNSAVNLTNATVMSQSGDPLTVNANGHWKMLLYQQTLTVTDPLNHVLVYSLASVPAQNKQVCLRMSPNGKSNCAASIKNLKISKVAF